MTIKQSKLFYGELHSVEDKVNEFIKELELTGRGVSCFIDVKQCMKKPANVLATVVFKEMFSKVK